jgi:Molybdenum Cofactor Synthesis C
MPFDGNKWQTSKLVPYQELLSSLREMYGDLERLEDDKNDTSKGWRAPGYKGNIGFITSMTDHFCGTCNRLRITADGNLKVSPLTFLLLPTSLACSQHLLPNRSASSAIPKYRSGTSCEEAAQTGKRRMKS